MTVLDVAEGIRRLIGSGVRIEFVPDRPGDFHGKTVSAEKVGRARGWHAEVDFDQGLERSVDWFLNAWGMARPAAAKLEPCIAAV